MCFEIFNDFVNWFKKKIFKNLKKINLSPKLKINKI